MAERGPYSIRELSRETGVAPVTLRAWERRYGLLRPGRTARGHRVYEETDLRRVNDIVHWVQKGVAISRVAALLESGDRASSGEAPGALDEVLAESLTALAGGNARRLEKALSAQLALYPLEQVITGYIQPLRRYLRERRADPLARAQLALFESLAQQKLGVRLLNLAPTRRQQGVLLGPLGRPDSLDLMLLALASGARLPLWCHLEETDVEAMLAGAVARQARALLFCLAPDITGTRLRRCFAGRARRLAIPVYVCCPAGTLPASLPAGVRGLAGDACEAAGALAKAGEGDA